MKAEDDTAPYGWANEHNKYFEHLQAFEYDDLIHSRSIRLVKLDCRPPQKRQLSDYIRPLALRRRNTLAQPGQSMSEQASASYIPLIRAPLQTGLWRKLKNSVLFSGSDDMVMVAARASYRIGKPGDETFSPLEVSMQEFPWDHLPPFEAISYVWGPHEMRAIICNGRTMMVSRNCAMSLYNLSHDYNKAMTRWVWIDQISINQSNTAEKGAQVNMMGDIYSIANRTVAWLGEANAQNQQCFRRFDDIRNESRRHKYIETYVTQYTEEELDITACISGEWFRRGWITQEAGLSQKLDFLCGDWVYPWEALYEVYRAVRRQKVVKVQLMNDIERLYHVRWRLLECDVVLSLPDAIRCSMSTQTLHPLDRFYSLYGLCNTLRDVLGRPDYHIQPNDLLTVLTRGVLREWGPQSRVFWALVASFGGKASKSGLSSWIPDFYLPLSSVQCAYLGGTQDMLPEATGPGADLENVLSDDLQRLTCKGVRIDSLSKRLWSSTSDFSNALCPDPDWPEEPEAVHAALKKRNDAERCYESLVDYNYGATIPTERNDPERFLMHFIRFLDLPTSTTGYQYNESTFNGTAPWSTENDHFVLVPQEACEHDVIVYFKGSLCLLLVRPKEDMWEVIGACRLYALTLLEKLETRTNWDEFTLT